MTTLRPTNDPDYRAMVRMLKVLDVKCWHQCGRRATSPDHQPPVNAHTHIRGTGCCELRPSCLTCQRKQGAGIVNTRRASGYSW